jgi:hypothetical protein
MRARTARPGPPGLQPGLAALAVVLLPLLPACRPRETLEATRARSTETLLLAEIEDLRKLVAKTEAGDLVLEDRIAIGIAEATSKALLQVSLPQERVIGDRLRVRLETAEPYFRGNNAVLLFRASARTLTGSAEAHLEMGGRLKDFRIEKGKLMSGIELMHFKVLDSSLGDMGSDVLENLVRDNMDSLSSLLPGLEIPVMLEESIRIPGLREGVVVVKPGVLPMQMGLSEVIPIDQRLWILLEVKAGPWQKQDDAEKSG